MPAPPRSYFSPKLWLWIIFGCALATVIEMKLVNDGQGSWPIVLASISGFYALFSIPILTVYALVFWLLKDRLRDRRLLRVILITTAIAGIWVTLLCWHPYLHEISDGLLFSWITLAGGWYFGRPWRSSQSQLRVV